MLKSINQNGKITIVVVLLIIIAFSAIILGLKITGVIKPSQTDVSNTSNTEIQDNQNTQLNQYKSNIKNDDSYEELLQTYTMRKNISIIIILAIYIVGIGLNVGICMLYKKLQVPDIIVKFNFIWPILNAISSFLPGFLQTILNFVSFIFVVAGLWYYFKSVGMSSWWGIVPIVSALSSFLSIFGVVFLILPLAGFTSFVIAYIISNLHLAKMFDKSTGFTIGLVLLPLIFQPILGFQRD